MHAGGLTGAMCTRVWVALLHPKTGGVSRSGVRACYESVTSCPCARNPFPAGGFNRPAGRFPKAVMPLRLANAVCYRPSR